jgi:hypothetical protein
MGSPSRKRKSTISPRVLIEASAMAKKMKRIPFSRICLFVMAALQSPSRESFLDASRGS